MKIKINNGSDYWLAGAPADPFKSQASNLRVNGKRLVQPDPRIRANAMTHFDRLNLATSLTFEVSRTHASLVASELFVLDHPTEVPGSGTVTFDTGGGTRVLHNAVVEAVDCKYAGISTTHAYTLRGGQITSS